MAIPSTASPRQGSDGPARRRKVVVVGGGFGGVACVRALRGADADITLVDRCNHTLFQPLLYQVATGVLDDSAIASPLRRIFDRRREVAVVRAEVEGFDFDRRVVHAEGIELPWDHLVVAAGVRTNYFGREWAHLAPGLKTLEDAHLVRARILDAFERADAARIRGDLDEVAGWLSFVVVGGGATGVELAGAIKQLAVDRLTREFHHLDVEMARVILADGGDRLLQSMSERSSRSAAKVLTRYGVEIRLHTLVTDVTEHGVRFRTRSPDAPNEAGETGETETFEQARTVIWAAGVTASPLATAIGEGLGIDLAPGGMVPVGPDLSVEGRPDIRVVGDLAFLKQADGTPVPGVAQAALQGGEYAGRAIRRIIAGRRGGAKAFRYRDKGSLATIGRGQAVLDIGRFHLAGFLGWVVWAIVHIAFLVNFRSRIAAMGAWAWAYVFQDGVNELITLRDVRGDVRESTARDEPAA